MSSSSVNRPARNLRAAHQSLKNAVPCASNQPTATEINEMTTFSSMACVQANVELTGATRLFAQVRLSAGLYPRPVVVICSPNTTLKANHVYVICRFVSGFPIWERHLPVDARLTPTLACISDEQAAWSSLSIFGEFHFFPSISGHGSKPPR